MKGSVLRIALVLVLLLAGLVSAQTARFPGAVATDQDLLAAVDNAFSQLAAPIANGTALTISVNSGATFAGKTNFTVTIESEQMLICSVVANTLNVCAGGRGFAGTTPAAHLAGVAVRANQTAWHHDATAAEVKAVQNALGVDLAYIEKPLTFDAPLSRNTNAISCATCVITSVSYSDPAWLTLTKAKVGLGSVENTALSTWAGSTNITTLGTISAGTVPWARLSNTPATYAPSAHTHPGGEVTGLRGGAHQQWLKLRNPDSGRRRRCERQRRGLHHDPEASQLLSLGPERRHSGSNNRRHLEG